MKIAILAFIFLLSLTAAIISYMTSTGAMPLGALFFLPAAVITFISLGALIYEIVRKR